MSSLRSRLPLRHREIPMTTKLGAISSSAWDSGIDFRADRPYRHRPQRRPVDLRQAEVARLPRVRRGSPPPLDDDIDTLGSLVFVMFFVLLVWL